MDKYIVRDLGRDGSPKCRLRKTSADLRQMSASQIPKRMRQKGTTDLGQDGSPKCRLRKKSADLRQMSGSQIPKRMRQKGTWDGTDLPNAASGKSPRISGGIWEI